MDRVFCNWCEAYIPAPDRGTSAGVFRRFVAAAVDPALFWLAWGIGSVVLGTVLRELSPVLVLLGLTAWYFVLLHRGTTLGKALLGERVVLRTTGRDPGILRMLVRETVGKMLSSLPLGLGFSGRCGIRTGRHGTTSW